MDFVILPDAASLAKKAADIVQDQIASSSRVLLALAGGSTPRSVHDQLAIRPIDWSDVTAWVADERWVPPTSEDANQQMIRESITDVVGVRFVAPDTTLTTPAVAATAYGDEIVPLITERDVTSITMLGIGTDGHTASLFPGTTALTVRSLAYVANFVPQLDAWRLTATFRLIAESDMVVFVVSGESKAEVMAGIVAGDDHPAARVEAKQRVLWLLDEPAAAHLT
ncbi:MAG: 6-phosphogluconolactonase [Acidimicrobiia bacterium]